jgi:hypothetical protein
VLRRGRVRIRLAIWSEWRIRRHLAPGGYTIRVSARDAAGNVTRRPVAIELRVRSA